MCALYCLAFFGIEFTVGVSWAIPLDIAGDRAGSVSSVMNMCGNIGGAISPIVLPYVVKSMAGMFPFSLRPRCARWEPCFTGKSISTRKVAS